MFQSELMEGMDRFGKSSADLMAQAAKRQYELKDPHLRDDLAAARAVLKKHSMMLLTASKAYVRHPELAAAKANRDYVLRQVCDAVTTISDVAQERNGSLNTIEGNGELSSALNDFDQSILMDPAIFNDTLARPGLEERLESIISGSALMADSSCTRDERREKIVAECNAVRQALQDLISEFLCSGGAKSDHLEGAIDVMCHKTKDLRRQLRKAVVDHVSDTFIESTGPLYALIDLAKSGNERQVEELSEAFTEHSNKLVEVANLACSMSGKNIFL